MKTRCYVDEVWKDLNGDRARVIDYSFNHPQGVVRQRWSDALTVWCEANCAGKWEREGSGGAFWFYDFSDADLFRIRFG